MANQQIYFSGSLVSLQLNVIHSGWLIRLKPSAKVNEKIDISSYESQLCSIFEPHFRGLEIVQNLWKTPSLLSVTSRITFKYENCLSLVIYVYIARQS